MGTLVCFHAHPDDEAIATGGTMAKAAAGGHRVVLVTATGGELGEVAEGVLGPGESLSERRAAELREAARILGVARHEFLGYVDSGMAGEPTNDDPACFWQADVDEAAGRLAKILEQEGAHALTVYDEHGVYGHPDHVQVHRVGLRAAALAGTPSVFEATLDRERMLERVSSLTSEASEAAAAVDAEIDRRALHEMGSPRALINTVVDVQAWALTKRAALLAHASQVPPDSWWAQLSEEEFRQAFGTEWFIRRDPPPGWSGTDLLEGVE